MFKKLSYEWEECFLMLEEKIPYFAYGSNLSVKRIESRLGQVEVLRTNVKLLGHTLEFHKAGSDGSAKADVIFCKDRDSYVLGVIYLLSKPQEKVLDQFEGLGTGYNKKLVDLFDEQGGYLQAMTYYAIKTRRGMLPYRWYLEHIIKGASEHGLHTDYIAFLKETASTEDIDRKRALLEFSIYL